MQYKAVIFDLDGTLINSLDDLADSANAMLESYGYPTFSVERYRYFVGNGSRKLIERVLPEAKRTPEFIDEALAKYKGIYEKNILTKTRPYAGILEMLATLRQQGIPLGLCTNKHQEAATAIVRGLFPAGTFQQVIGDRPGYPRKPDPTTALEIAAALGAKPAETAYLGDSLVDMQTGVNAGFLPVGVLWGFREKAELVEHGAAVLLEKPVELLEKVDFVGKK